MKNTKPTQPAPQPAPQPPIQLADMAQIALWVVQIGDHQRAIGEIASRLYNEIDKRNAILMSLSQPKTP